MTDNVPENEDVALAHNLLGTLPEFWSNQLERVKHGAEKRVFAPYRAQWEDSTWFGPQQDGLQFRSDLPEAAEAIIKCERFGGANAALITNPHQFKPGSHAHGKTI